MYPYINNKIQSIFYQYDQRFKAMIDLSDQKYEELKHSRGKQYKQSKNIGHKLVNLISENPYTESLIITTTPPQFISEDYFDTKIQATFAWSDKYLKNNIDHWMS